MLKAGQNGAFSGLISLLENDAGSRNIVYFWFTGILSAFLDNAPAYLMFFNLAGGEASTLMTTSAQTLIAISLGAVFMGALTYIGNTPNFVVKAIAEEKGIKMPSFFGYLAWSTAILVPLLAVVGWLWI
jgi:Na+/H+ antiporter NhaD/arsenite permease-like protein